MKCLFAVKADDVKKIEPAVREFVELLSRRPSKAGGHDRRVVRTAVDGAAYRELGIDDSEWDEIQSELSSLDKRGRTLSAQVHLAPKEVELLAAAVSKIDSVAQARVLAAFLTAAAKAESHIFLLAK